MALLLLIDFTKIRKDFGWLVCGIYAICIVSMPNFMYYTLTIRMYSFAMFFVTVTYLIAFDLTKASSFKNWILLTVFVILSFYTHYYAVIGCLIIYLMLLIYFILNNRQQIKYLILSGIVSFLAYIPWIYIILTQINKYHDNYWIQPLYGEQLLRTFWYVFSSNTFSSMIIGILLVCSLVILIYCFIKDTNKEKIDFLAICALSILIFTIVFGLLISIFIMPLFNERYVFPILGIFWLGFSILLAKNYENKKIFAFCLVILLCASCINTIYYINSSDIASRDMEILGNITFEEGDVIIHDNLHTQLTFERWYCPQCDNYNYYDSDVNSMQIIDEAFANNHTVWVFYRDSGSTRLRGSDGSLLNALSQFYNLEPISKLEPDPFNNIPTEIFKVNSSK